MTTNRLRTALIATTLFASLGLSGCVVHDRGYRGHDRHHDGDYRHHDGDRDHRRHDGDRDHRYRDDGRRHDGRWN